MLASAVSSVAAALAMRSSPRHCLSPGKPCEVDHTQLNMQYRLANFHEIWNRIAISWP